jgi:hypothetical protein
LNKKNKRAAEYLTVRTGWRVTHRSETWKKEAKRHTAESKEGQCGRKFDAHASVKKRKKKSLGYLRGENQAPCLADVI